MSKNVFFEILIRKGTYSVVIRRWLANTDSVDHQSNIMNDSSATYCDQQVV